MKEEMEKRGVVVVRGVTAEHNARAYKKDIGEYIRRNPHSRGYCID